MEEQANARTTFDFYSLDVWRFGTVWAVSRKLLLFKCAVAIKNSNMSRGRKRANRNMCLKLLLEVHSHRIFFCVPIWDANSECWPEFLHCFSPKSFSKRIFYSQPHTHTHTNGSFDCMRMHDRENDRYNFRITDNSLDVKLAWNSSKFQAMFAHIFDWNRSYSMRLHLEKSIAFPFCDANDSMLCMSIR